MADAAAAVKQAAAARASRGRSKTSKPPPALLLSAGYDGVVRQWHLTANKTPQQEFQLDHDSPVLCAVWNPNRSVVVTSQKDGQIGFYEKERRISQRRSRKPAHVLAFGGDGLTLYTGCEDGLVVGWSLRHMKEQSPLLGHRGIVATLAVSSTAAGDEYIASGSSHGDLLLHHLLTNQKFALNEGAVNQAVNHVAFSTLNRKNLASADDSGAVVVWDVSTRKQLARFTCHSAPASGTIFSPVNLQLLCSCGNDGRLVFYDVRSGKMVKTMACGTPLNCLDYYRDGVTVAVGALNGQCMVYDLRRAQRPTYLLSQAHKGKVTSLHFPPERRASFQPRKEAWVPSPQTASATAEAAPSYPRDSIYSPARPTLPAVGTVPAPVPSSRANANVDFRSPLAQRGTDQSLILTPPPSKSQEESTTASAGTSWGRLRLSTDRSRLERIAETSREEDSAKTPHRSPEPVPSSISPLRKSKPLPVIEQDEEEEDKPNIAALQHSIVTGVVKDILQDFRDAVHKDIANVHMELLRQTHDQQRALAEAVRRLTSTQETLLTEVRDLRKQFQQGMTIQ